VKKELPLIGHTILDNLPMLMEILNTPLSIVRNEEPFGALRLIILRVIKVLVEGCYPGIQEKILNSSIFEFILKSFGKFPKNNLFHATSSHLICLCFHQRNSTEIVAFLTAASLVNIFISTENDPSSAKYRMWFHLISRVLIDRAKRFKEVSDYLDKIVGWNDYRAKVLSEKSKEDQFDRERLKEDGERGHREESVAFLDDDVGIILDHSRLTGDVDIDSKTDADEVELNETEMCVNKFEIENFIQFVV